MSLYQTIFDELKADIERGRYTKAFPSEAQLVTRFSTSRQTIVKVMAELTKVGLVERYRGSGTVVSRRVRGTLGCVGLVLPSLDTAPFVAALTEVCRGEGYTPLFRDFTAKDMMLREGSDEIYRDRAASVRALAMDLAEAKVTGVLMQPMQLIRDAASFNRELLTALRAKRIPVVLVDHDICDAPERSGCDVVALDNFHAGYRIGCHLVARGARRIAFMAHKDWAPSVNERLRGICVAALENGLAWDFEHNLISCRAGDAKGVARAIRSLHPDAIACGNDRDAQRLMETLHELKIDVPRRIRVTGFDDMPFAATISPALTTVRQDFSRIARLASERLVWRIRHSDEPPVTILEPGELIVRAST